MPKSVMQLLATGSFRWVTLAPHIAYVHSKGISHSWRKVRSEMQQHCFVQAVRKLDTDIVRLKAAAAVAQQTATAQAEETRVAHDKQVAALKLANDVLQQQLAQMVESVPAMLR